jgi:hypothetical protein
MKKIYIKDEINIIYYYISKCENIDNFYLHFYIYKIYCIAENDNVNILLIIDFLNKLLNYIRNLILTNKEYIYEINQIKKSYKKLEKNMNNKNINEYIEYIKTQK